MGTRDGVTHARLPLPGAGLPYIMQIPVKGSQTGVVPGAVFIIRLLNKLVPIGRSNGTGNDEMGTR